MIKDPYQNSLGYATEHGTCQNVRIAWKVSKLKLSHEHMEINRAVGNSLSQDCFITLSNYRNSEKRALDFGQVEQQRPIADVVPIIPPM